LTKGPKGTIPAGEPAFRQLSKEEAMLGCKRLVAITALASALVWLGTAPAAAAGNPDRQPLPTPGDLTIACSQGFDAVAHVVANNEYLLSFSKSDGTQIFMVNGYFAATVSGNGKSFFFNASGPGTFVFRPDGSQTIVDRGRGLYITPDLTDISLLTGRLTVDAGGNIISHSGTTTDICALLAS
jgi:hypothetical protein